MRKPGLPLALPGAQLRALSRSCYGRQFGCSTQEEIGYDSQSRPVFPSVPNKRADDLRPGPDEAGEKKRGENDEDTSPRGKKA